MALVGRRREMAEVGRLLDCAADGCGGVLAITGPPGSGRTELAAAAARAGARRGFEVLRTAAVRGQPGVLVWARLLADAGAPDDLASRRLADAGPLALDSVARVLGRGNRRLLVIDEIDHGGAAALQVLQVVAARAAVASIAMVVTLVLPLGVGTGLRLGRLSEEDLASWPCSCTSATHDDPKMEHLSARGRLAPLSCDGGMVAPRRRIGAPAVSAGFASGSGQMIRFGVLPRQHIQDHL